MTRVMSVRRPSAFFVAKRARLRLLFRRWHFFCWATTHSYYIKFTIFYDFVMTEEAT